MLPIVTDTKNPVLREKTKTVKDPHAPELKNLLDEMLVTMRRAEGIGLAANQVGVSLRVCVTEIEGVVRYFLNPNITSFSREKLFFEEGCLSVPGKFLSIERSEAVTVRYLDETGTEKKERLRGLQAICLQHEVDHLDGILILDRYKNQKNKHSYAL